MPIPIRFPNCMRQNCILLLTLLCIAVGIGIGVILHTFNKSETVILYVGLFGELFMRALNFSVLPLLSCNIVAVTAKMKPTEQGLSALLAFAYCVVMNLVGSFSGLLATVIIKPGDRINNTRLISIANNQPRTIINMEDIFPDFMRNLVPDNILKSMLFSTLTSYVSTEVPVSDNQSTVVLKPSIGETSGPNILGILSSSLVLGLIAGSRGETTRPIIALAEAVTEVMTVLIEKIVSLLPLAMISLVAAAIARLGSLQQGLIALALFVGAAAVYLTLMAIGVLPLFYFIVTRRNLFRVYVAIKTALLTAFSLTSSLIALPDLFVACDRLGISPQLVRIIAPFLTSFNANGSAAFIASAVCFTAQLSNRALNPGQLISIGLLAGINVMALPAVPSASLITVLLIMRIMGIPESAISLLFVVEFIVDRMRTVLNVMSHGTCIAFVHAKTRQSKEGTDDRTSIPVLPEFHADVATDSGINNQTPV